MKCSVCKKTIKKRDDYGYSLYPAGAAGTARRIYRHLECDDDGENARTAERKAEAWRAKYGRRWLGC